ncbi:MAG TPA: MoaD/ThiS family protein [bacterium]|nr:MoaD/ThiS family protein [bacterium]
MPEIKVKFYALLRSKVGRDEMTVTASRLKDVMNVLKRDLGPEAVKVISSCHVYINQDNVAFLKGERTSLKEGDVVHILPPTGGG